MSSRSVSSRAKNILITPELGAVILAEKLGLEVKKQKYKTDIVSRGAEGLIVGVEIALAAYIAENILKYYESLKPLADIANYYATPATVLGGGIGLGAFAAVIKLKNKALEKYAARSIQQVDEQGSNLAIESLNALGISVEKPEALTWTNGKLYMIKEAGENRNLQVVGKALFKKFLREETAKDAPLHSIYSSENSSTYNRSCAGKLMGPEDGSPSSITLKTSNNPQGFQILQRQWHLEDVMFKSETLVRSSPSAEFHEITGKDLQEAMRMMLSDEEDNDNEESLEETGSPVFQV